MFRRAISILSIGIAFLFSPFAQAWPWDRPEPAPLFPNIEDCRPHPDARYARCKKENRFSLFSARPPARPPSILSDSYHWPSEAAQCSEEISAYMVRVGGTLIPRFRNGLFTESERQILTLRSSWILTENLGVGTPRFSLHGTMPGNQNSEFVQNFNSKFYTFLDMTDRFLIQTQRVPNPNGSPCEKFLHHHITAVEDLRGPTQRQPLFTLPAAPATDSQNRAIESDSTAN